MRGHAPPAPHGSGRIIFLHFPAFPRISLQFLTFPCISLQFLTFHIISLHFLAIPYISYHFLVIPGISLHFSSFPCISWHVFIFPNTSCWGCCLLSLPCNPAVAKEGGVNTYVNIGENYWKLQ